MHTPMKMATDILAALEGARDSRPEVQDLPQHDSHEKRRHTLAVLTGDISAELAIICRYATRRQRLEADHLLLRRLRMTIEQMLDDAPNHRRIADRKARTAAWAHSNALLASLQALHRGVEYFGGRPALPDPLRELLVEAEWPGAIPAVEQAITKLDATIRVHQAQLDQLVDDATRVLAVNQ